MTIRSDSIALIGIGCRFPGNAQGPAATWAALCGGVDAVGEVPPSRWDVDAWYSADPESPGKTITRQGSFLPDVARFDAARFGISPREALQMDPQQRLLLEVAWEALEDAGAAPDRLEGSATGTWVGMGMSDYGRRSFLGPDPTRIDAYAGTGTFSSVAAGRVAYALGLRGPALTVHTACSSSLVAIHLATRALRAGTVDLALAGGVNLILAPEPSVYFSKLGALSTDGRCRTFDARASGYGRGEGCGVLVLKRLSDAIRDGDRIHVVIRGSAINHDGRSNGLTAPSGSAQQAVIRAALADAELEAAAIGLIEAHGTATPLGDPIEARALAEIYGPGRDPCVLRSVKTSFGHTEAAAGVAGVIAAALSVAHGQAPPHLHFEGLNPRISLKGTRLAIPEETTGLVARRAAVSAFGLSGTNAHLLLEAAPGPPDPHTLQPSRPELLVISASSERALDLLRPEYAAVLGESRLEDVARSAASGRALLAHRLAVVASDSGDAASQLAAGQGLRGHATRPGGLVFAFTGQGSQWHGMARSLYRSEAAFRDAFDEVDTLLRRHRGASLVEVVFGEVPELVGQTSWTQPSLFAVGWALSRLWAHWGIEPDAVLGHSIGEITAATVAGVLTLEDAVALVAERGRLMGELPDGGGMAAVRASTPPVKEAIAGLADLGIAAVNSPNETVISGPLTSVHQALQRLAERGVEGRVLDVSHAFHSPLVEPVLAPFSRVLDGTRFHAPSLPLYSNLTGRRAGDEVRTTTYWREHVRKPVRFAQGLQAAHADGFETFLELGPHPVLGGMGARTLPDSHWLASMRRGRDARATMLEALGSLVVRGWRPEADTVWDGAPAVRVDLPLTPLDGERYWLEQADSPTADAVPAWSVRWVEADADSPPRGAWWVDGDPDAVASVASGLAESGAEVRRGLPARLGEGDVVVHVVPPARSAAHGWEAGPARIRQLWRSTGEVGARLWVVTRAASAAVPTDRVDPNMAACKGLARVLALEDPQRWGGLIDLPSGGASTEQIVRAFSSGEPEVAVRDRLLVPRLAPREASRTGPPRADGSWLVTGGFGALGSAVARWLAEQGVRRLVLASRKGADTPERKTLVRALEGQGVAVTTVRIDIADKARVVSMVDKIDDLIGVVHCAGEVSRGPVDQQDTPSFTANLTAKVLGAEALDAATRGRSLDAFVLFSSVAAAWGSVGLGGYAAANAWLDGLAEQRRSRGLAGTSLAWGPWASPGMVDGESRSAFARMGVRAIPEPGALQALAHHLRTRGHRILADVDWNTFAPLYRARRPRPLLDLVAPIATVPHSSPPTGLAALPSDQRIEALQGVVSTEVRAVLGLAPGAPLDPDLGFFDLGMDSLMAVELQRRLRDRAGIELPTTAAFDHPSVRALAGAAAEVHGWSASDNPVDPPTSRQSEPIAIVGWSVRFPGAPNVAAYESLLFDGRCAVGPAPARAGGIAAGVLEGIDEFDAEYFGIGSAEAAAMDPQQRWVLEGSVEALECAGIAPDRLSGRPVGVFLGIAHSAYWDQVRARDDEAWPWSGVGNEQSFAAGRVAYSLGLTGPAMAVNTACSSSLVAVHLAVEALRNGSCELALAAGVNALLAPEDTAWLTQIGALSPTGRCHTFDARADGYVRSEGCGVLALQPLSKALADDRPILGVIRGTAVGHGGASGGLTVPNGPAQADVIRRALTDAGARPEEVGYVECHGTGTALGDPIELGALRTVFADRTEPLAVGASKANIGHLETASGVAGLVAAALVLSRREAPASPLLQHPNPSLPTHWPVSLPDRGRAVRGLAGVSSFGISGTNAHVVLDAAPTADSPTVRARGTWLIPVSAHHPRALEVQVERVRSVLELSGPAGLPAMGRTLVTGRSARAHRRALVARSAAEANARQGVSGVVEPGRTPRVGWLFSGQGAQRVGMALDLARELPLFGNALSRVESAFEPHLDRPLRELLASEALHDTRYTQPALFAVEWALAQTLLELGCRPSGLLGHSLGEWVAATLAGVLPLESAAAVVSARGRAMSEQPGGGAMLAVRASEATVAPLCSDGAELAAINGPEDVVISGPTEAIRATEGALTEAGLEHRRLTVSHPFHSAGIEGALPTLRAELEGVQLTAPSLPIYSNLDGEELGLRAAHPGYWVAQARQPVRFGDGLANLAASVDVLVEVGPRPALLGLAGRGLAQAPALVPLLREGGELQAFLDAVAALWVRGSVDRLEPLYPSTPVASLPSVAWQRTRHWAAGPPSSAPIYCLVDDEVQGATGTPVDLAVDTVSEALDRIEAALAAAAGPLDVVAPGALSAEGPAARAAAIGLVATVRAERPDRTIRLTDPAAAPKRWAPWRGEPSTIGGTWAVTGARGQLGRRIVRWLVDRGCSVVGVSRGVDPQLAALDGVRWVQADIGTEVGVKSLVGERLDGVIHCAGINHPGLLGRIDRNGLAEIEHAKLTGAMRLADAIEPATRLVLFGSATSWLGLPGQAAYAAVNAALEGLALRRPNTVCLAWGPWRAGMAAESGVDWAALGVRPLEDDAALAALERAMSPGTPANLAVIDIDAAAFQRARGALPLLQGLHAVDTAPPGLVDELRPLAPAARLAHLEGLVADAARAVLGRSAVGGFFESGMDSLGAVELSRRVGSATGLSLPATIAFDHPSTDSLALALLDRLAVEPAAESGPRVVASEAAHDDPIAVVGLACRFPGADDDDALWALISGGGHAIGAIPSDRWDAATWFDPDPQASGKMYVRQGAFLDEIDRFDPDLFGISPRESAALDPQQRLLLETAWRALDDAGSLHETGRTGVFVGVAERGWLRRFEAEDRPHYADAWSGTGAESSFAAGRVAHSLGLRGPAIALNTTCSSSLVAIHLAADAIRRGDCDRALAGGVHLVLDPESTAYLCRLGALSPTARCHTFDARADGYVRGEGCGILVLKRLSVALADGDRVRAVLRGSAINHDGHASGLTVPSGPAQTEVIRAALDNAGIGPDGIGWLQAHGTGTPLGDPIELTAAARALAGRSAPLPVGTVKTAIGHCELAAGSAGAIAAILALEHEQIPPHPLNEPNPELDLEPWELPRAARPWPRGGSVRRVGVSAFGLSGTNAHVIFEEGPVRAASRRDEGPRITLLAAHSEPAFAEVQARAASGGSGLAGRSRLPWRRAVVGPVSQDGVPVRAGSPPRVALLFTGQGSQWAGMHRALLGLPAFTETLDRALEVLARVEPSLGGLREILDDEAALGRTEHTQPALWAFEVAAAAQWQAMGLQPVAVAGHSVGEIAAATVAGGLTFEDGARLVAARGRLMGSLPEGGAMLVAHAPEPVAVSHCAPGVEVTGVNDPEETALAGPSNAVDATAHALEAAGIRVTRLNVSHAFHTARMDPILDAYQSVASEIGWHAPSIPLVSTLRGERLTHADPAYWREHARRAVRFAEAMRTLEGMGCDGFVECGPHPILVRMGQRTIGAGRGLWVGTVRRHDTDHAETLRSVGRWWERGGSPTWSALGVGRQPSFPYPMQRRRLWPDGDRWAGVGWALGLNWEEASPAPPPALQWVVLGSDPVASTLRTELGASDSLDDLRAGMGVIDADSRSRPDLVDQIDAARAVARRALDVGARVWWHTENDGLDAWARAAFAEHPDLRGGLVSGADGLAGALALGEASADGEIRVPRLAPVTLGSPPAIHGTWLLVGGLGTLGRRVAAWLADRGATRMLLTARTERTAGLEALRERVDVVLGTFDASDRAALERFTDGEQITGVVYLAGVTDPQPVLTADAAREAGVVHGKIRGAEVLDAWARTRQLEHFVLFGSIAATWGSRELGGYGAANARLGAIARRRRAAGLAAVCIHWGPWGGGGMVDAEREARLARMGQHALEPHDALRLLGAALGSDRAELVAARVDWERFLGLVEAGGTWSRFDRWRTTAPIERVEVVDLPAEVARLAREILRVDDLNPEQPLMELGFDSLMATELNNALLARGIDVPLGRLLGGPSVEEIVVMAGAVPATTASSTDEAEPPLFWTHLAAAILGAAIASALWFAL